MAEEKEGRVKSVMSGGDKKKKSKKKKSKKKKHSSKVHKMHLSRTANDKYTAEHEFEPDASGVAPPSETHGLENIDELKDHVAEHMAPQENEEQANQTPAEPAPGGGAPSPMMGM